MARRDGKVRYVNEYGYVEWPTPSEIAAAEGISANHFNAQMRDGTTIYGDKEAEGRTGFSHGHVGDDFHRGPHSSLGSAALGDRHSSDEHKHDRTERW